MDHMLEETVVRISLACTLTMPLTLLLLDYGYLMDIRDTVSYHYFRFGQSNDSSGSQAATLYVTTCSVFIVFVALQARIEYDNLKFGESKLVVIFTIEESQETKSNLISYKISTIRLFAAFGVGVLITTIVHFFAPTTVPFKDINIFGFFILAVVMPYISIWNHASLRYLCWKKITVYNK